MKELIISLGDDSIASAILGQGDTYLYLIDRNLAATIMVRGNKIHLRGTEDHREHARNVFKHLKNLAKAQVEINEDAINYVLDNWEKSQDNMIKDLTGNLCATQSEE